VRWCEWLRGERKEVRGKRGEGEEREEDNFILSR